MKRIKQIEFYEALLILFFVSGFAAAQTVEERINELLSQMTLEEKILQLHKAGAMHTEDNTRLGIPGFIMADGPHGVRDGLATSFPVGIAIAATFDTELAERVGLALGKEFRGKGKHQMLGPAIDLTRDPRNGRTPESGGEDPYLNALINAAIAKGVQNAGAIATAKHYNGKHKQIGRNENNYSISQRNLLEHYGFNFRTLIQDAGVFSIMSAYNKVNGEQAAESKNLLTTILRDEWGFPYYVVSDWGAVHSTEKAISAGTDICMGSDHYQNNLKSLVENGTVAMEVVDEAVRRVLRTKIFAGLLNYIPAGDPADVNSPAHQALCLEAGKKSIVLLKNANNILPLDKNKINKIAVIGPNANIMQTDGSGSSWVTPFYTVTPRQGIENYVGSSKVLYAKGCDISGGFASDFANAIIYAQQADLVIYFGGLDPSQEGEGFDRVNGSIELPAKQKEMIDYLVANNQKVIVVLISGGICGVSGFVNKIAGLIQAFYPGQEGGNAIAQVLFGDYNPSGRLPVTLPLNDGQLGSEITDFDFNNDNGCGYRWFDTKGMTPQFAFGYGLSYTTFGYSNIKANTNYTHAGNMVDISVDVTNTGERAGEEVVQLYLTENPSFAPKPPKELKGFRRIKLEPGETKTVSFHIGPNELYHYSQQSRAYEIDPGIYKAQIGGSSDKLVQSIDFEIRQPYPTPDLQVKNLLLVPPYPLKGDKVMFYATIVNRGTGPSQKGVVHDVLFSVNGNPVSRSFELTDSIAKGGMALLAGNLAIDGKNYWEAENIGEYTVEAWVDNLSEIKETIETNNKLTKTFKVYDAPPVNLALKKSVAVSSVESSLYIGSFAVDGNYGTRWSSQFSDPQSIVIDFGSSIDFNRVFLYWEAAYGKEYKLEISDDKSNWTMIVHQTAGAGGVEKFSIDAKARYLRLLGLKRGTQYGYSLYEIEVFNVPDPTSVRSSDEKLPFDFALDNNYPNPFNPSTTISYEVPRSGNVKIEIFNSIGELIKVLVDKHHSAGKYSERWDGTDLFNRDVSSGVYFYRMHTAGFKLVKKMMLMR